MGESDWLHVIVCRKDEQEFYMGMHDKNDNVDFVPVFESRDDAESCLESFGKQPGIRYQVMAILSSELIENCTDRNYLIALVDKHGAIIRQFAGEK